MAKIKDFLHPIWRSALSKYGNKENIDFLGALQKPLDDTETDILNNKVQLYLASAQAHWLDYWGTWLGLRRKKSEEDTTFRNRMINHVLHSRDTVKSIKKAIADFIQTNEDNIYIYEPFRDMLYWNSGDCYNTLKYFPSSYYNYAIIDVHIDASFPPEVVEIINLFRPAGVIWVLTDDVNGVDPTVEPIDFNLESYNAIDDELWDYAGFYQRETYRLTSYYNDNEITDTPFIWNSSSWNSGNVYYRGANKFDTVVTVGQLYQDYTPLATDNYEATRVYSDQRNIEENSIISNYGSNGVAFTLQPVKDNLVTNQAGSIVTTKNDSSYVTKITYSISNINSSSSYDFGVLVNLLGTLDSTSSLTITLLDSGSNSVSTTIYSGSPVSKWYYGSVTTGSSFSSTGSIVFTFTSANDTSTSGIVLSNVVIRKENDSVPIYYSLNAAQNYTEQGLTCIYDVKQFLMRFTTYAVSQLSPTYIDNLFENKNFVITAKVPSLLNQTLGYTPYIYNFNLNIWVKLDKINFSSSYTSQNISINSIVQYLNNNCLLFIKLIPDSVLPISINYVGLTLANNDSISSPVLSDSQPDMSVTTG